MLLVDVWSVLAEANSWQAVKTITDAKDTP
jgi:hypothetical protein